MTLVPRPFSGDPRRHLELTSRLIAAHEPRIRAFTHLDTALLDAALLEALPDGQGPLGGMPIAVKEIIDVAGMPVTYGSEVFADRRAGSDAEAVARLRAAGALVLGMTTTTPFACGTTTATDNPVVPGHTPGGSSAGSGAAVGAGFVPVALGSQSQASTLRPASYCGVWGFKPSHGRLPVGGMHLLAPTLDDLGVLAAGVDDLRAVADVLLDPATPEPARSRSNGPRLAVLRLDDGGLPTAATLDARDEVIARVSDLMAVDDGCPDLAALDEELAGSGRTCFDLFAFESAPTLAAHVAAGERDPRLQEMIAHAEALGDEGYRRALERRAELRRRWAELGERYDAAVALATSNPAPLGHASTGCRRLPATSSLLGVPAVTAPWATVDGRPQGIQLLGFDGRDEQLLNLAAELDRHLAPSAAPTAEVP